MDDYGSCSEPLSMDSSNEVPLVRNLEYVDPETGAKLLCACNSNDVALRSDPEDSNPGTTTQLVCVYDSEAVPVRNLEYTDLESEGFSKIVPRRIRIPSVVRIALWMAFLLLELSPILILSTSSYADTILSDPNSTISTDDDDFADALRGVYIERACSFEECLSSPCRDASSTPFVCLALKHNQKVRGGCGETPWRPEVCLEQCNAIGCGHELQRVDEERSAKPLGDVDCDVACPEHWCRHHRLCGNENHAYQCTDGGAKYGCSADKFRWTLRSNDSECSSCCKTTTCRDRIEENPTR